MPTIPADLTERLSSWRQISAQSHSVAVRHCTVSKPLKPASGTLQRLHSGSLGWVRASCLPGGRQSNQYS